MATLWVYIFRETERHHVHMSKSSLTDPLQNCLFHFEIIWGEKGKGTTFTWNLLCFACVHIFKKDLFIFRETGRKGERKGEKHQHARETSFSCLSHAPQLGKVPDQEPNWWPFALWNNVPHDDTLGNWSDPGNHGALGAEEGPQCRLGEGFSGAGESGRR